MRTRHYFSCYFRDCQKLNFERVKLDHSRSLERRKYFETSNVGIGVVALELVAPHHQVEQASYLLAQLSGERVSRAQQS